MKRIHIFKAGEQISSTGFKRNFTEGDLQSMVDSFDPMLHEPPIRVGHEDSDKVPSFGWVKKVEKEGPNLYAYIDFTPEMEEMIKKGHYRKVSASFYSPASETNPKRGHYTLKHVAMLGGVPPAVKGLEPFNFSEDANGEIHTYIDFTEDYTEMPKKKKDDGTVFDEEVLKKQKKMIDEEDEDGIEVEKVDAEIPEEAVEMKEAKVEIEIETGEEEEEEEDMEMGEGKKTHSGKKKEVVVAVEPPAEEEEEDLEMGEGKKKKGYHSAEKEVEMGDCGSKKKKGAVMYQEDVEEEEEDDDDDMEMEEPKLSHSSKKKKKSAAAMVPPTPPEEDGEMLAMKEKVAQMEQMYAELSEKEAKALELQARLESMEAKFAEMEAAKAEAEAVLLEERRNRRREHLARKVSYIYSEGKLTEGIYAQDNLLDFAVGLEEGTLEFSEGESPADVLLDILSHIPVAVDYGEIASDNESVFSEAEEEEMEFSEKVEKFAIENGISFESALRQLAKDSDRV